MNDSAPMKKETHSPPAGRVVVLGATGYTGGLVVEALLRRGIRPVLAGSREQPLAKLAERVGDLDYHIADASQVSSIQNLLDPADVLITTVGPFARLGSTVAAAAAAQGAHYVDSTGETGFVREITQHHHTQAAKNGAVMLPAFGNDYVPGFLAAAHAVEQAGPTASSVEVGYFINGSLRGGRGLSRGTRTTTLEGLISPVLTWEQGQLVERLPARPLRSFSTADTTTTAVLASGTEVLSLAESYPHIQSVRVYNGWFPAMSPLMPAISAALRTAAHSAPRLFTSCKHAPGQGHRGPTPQSGLALEHRQLQWHAMQRVQCLAPWKPPDPMSMN